ncbi:serpin family protein [Candidatus Lokiarchaeum ossiferum]|uniref:serpin family protein n=1 Tax=Candidatus Lokiarchaeum ossiferum TaxID=2951803 RepID=UPI00352CFB1F
MTSYGFINFVSDFIYEYCNTLNIDFWDTLIRNYHMMKIDSEFNQLTHNREPNLSNIEEIIKHSIEFYIYHQFFSKDSGSIQDYRNNKNLCGKEAMHEEAKKKTPLIEKFIQENGIQSIQKLLHKLPKDPTFKRQYDDFAKIFINYGCKNVENEILEDQKKFHEQSEIKKKLDQDVQKMYQKEESFLSFYVKIQVFFSKIKEEINHSFEMMINGHRQMYYGRLIQLFLQQFYPQDFNNRILFSEWFTRCVNLLLPQKMNSYAFFIILSNIQKKQVYSKLYGLCKIPEKPPNIGDYHGILLDKSHCDALYDLETLIGEEIPIMNRSNRFKYGYSYENQRITIIKLDSKGINTLPATFEKLISLKHLSLTHNDFSNFPESIAKLEKLEYLNLENNQLASLPSILKSLSCLKTLILDWNDFVTFPNVICSLSNLEVLSLNGNSLQSLSESLCNLKNLKKLFLNENQLISIPESIAALSSLEIMDLKNNSLTSLPNALSDMKSLGRIILLGNYLSSLPEGLEELPKLNHLNLINQQQILPEKFETFSSQSILELYLKLKDSFPENIFISPFSIFSAFAMVYEGALDKTKNEIQKVFRFPEIESLRKNFFALFNRIVQGSRNYELKMGNALWIQKKYPIIEQYLQLMQKFYGGIARNLDFHNEPENSRQIINQFIETQTKGLIQDLIPTGMIRPTTDLILTNAIYFKGNWMIKFNPSETKKRNFILSSGNILKTPMMHMESEIFNYRLFKEAQILEIPYLENEISMLLLLPAKDISNLESMINTEKLEIWTHGLRKTKLDHIYIPKFEFNFKCSLKEILMSMGLTSAFSYKADFSKISKCQELFIHSVLHQAFVSVDEMGTKAAAATLIEMGSRSRSPPPIIFNANHPFLFLIQDNATGSILFMGKVMDPTKQ